LLQPRSPATLTRRLIGLALLGRPRGGSLSDRAKRGVCDVIVVIEQHNVHEHSDLIEEMFRLRARIFRDRLKWDVSVVDGKERDKYDDEGPVYIIDVDDETRRVSGSLRLLPTTGPTLLDDFFYDTRPAAAQLSAPTIWECTRFCLDDRILDHGHRDQLQCASGVLIAGVG
jgi:acyl homoserine lactone synthase